jgi:hypothetical protein
VACGRLLETLAQQYGISGLGAGYNTGNTAALEAARMYPQLAQAQLIGPQAIVQAGQGLTSSPWAALDQYRQAIGAGYSGSANTTSPYFQNEGANILSGLSGGLGIAKQLGGSGGLLSGLGGGAAAVNPGFAAGTGLGSGIFTDLATGATSDVLPSVATAATAGLGATIICTELVRQGQVTDEWRRAGMRVLHYPAIARRGYWVWALPVVRHLRQKPESLFSRIIAETFYWRAEDIAARAGVEGARKLWRGRVVTAAMVLPCLVCGVLCRPRDWRSVYRDSPT